MKSQPALILASTSVYRRDLLSRLKIPFECRSPGVEETPASGESAAALVVRLARAKALAVARAHPEAWVIGSDQAALVNGSEAPNRILGKPGSAANCIEQLQHCSGRMLQFFTAVCLLRQVEAAPREFMDTTRVIFRKLARTTIERYVARESPLDCAGGFKSEGLGIALCESIESADPTALIGLPLIRLAGLLRDVGYEVP